MNKVELSKSWNYLNFYPNHKPDFLGYHAKLKSFNQFIIKKKMYLKVLNYFCAWYFFSFYLLLLIMIRLK